MDNPIKPALPGQDQLKALNLASLFEKLPTELRYKIYAFCGFPTLGFRKLITQFEKDYKSSTPQCQGFLQVPLFYPKYDINSRPVLPVLGTRVQIVPAGSTERFKCVVHLPRRTALVLDNGRLRHHCFYGADGTFMGFCHAGLMACNSFFAAELHKMIYRNTILHLHKSSITTFTQRLPNRFIPQHISEISLLVGVHAYTPTELDMLRTTLPNCDVLHFSDVITEVKKPADARALVTLLKHVLPSWHELHVSIQHALSPRDIEFEIIAQDPRHRLRGAETTTVSGEDAFLEVLQICAREVVTKVTPASGDNEIEGLRRRMLRDIAWRRAAGDWNRVVQRAWVGKEERRREVPGQGFSNALLRRTLFGRAAAYGVSLRRLEEFSVEE